MVAIIQTPSIPAIPTSSDWPGILQQLLKRQSLTVDQATDLMVKIFSDSLNILITSTRAVDHNAWTAF